LWVASRLLHSQWAAAPGGDSSDSHVVEGGVGEGGEPGARFGLVEVAGGQGVGENAFEGLPPEHRPWLAAAETRPVSGGAAVDQGRVNELGGVPACPAAIDAQPASRGCAEPLRHGTTQRMRFQLSDEGDFSFPWGPVNRRLAAVCSRVNTFQISGLDT